jgi:hypothetical protein
MSYKSINKYSKLKKNQIKIIKLIQKVYNTLIER